VKVYHGRFIRLGESRWGDRIGVQWNQRAHRRWVLWLPRAALLVPLWLGCLWAILRWLDTLWLGVLSAISTILIALGD
jgi:hypothetical protein